MSSASTSNSESNTEAEVEAGGKTNGRRSRVRMTVLLLISVGTMINYLDRTVISVAAPAMSVDLGLNEIVMGVVFSLFSWSYAAAQIPGGAFLDRFGTRVTYFLSMAFWSVFTLLHSIATGLYSLAIYRLGLGIAEAPCFPTNSRVLSIWFPQNERARATSAFTIGEYFGLAFFSPILFWIVATMGWRHLFWITGLIGLVFAFVWLRYYRGPHKSRKVNQAELDYIRAGGGLDQNRSKARFEWRKVWLLLKKRQILGAAIGQFGGNSTLIFFLTWFPTYLVTQRNMEWLNAGFFVVLPFIAASFGLVIGGWLSDRIIRRTGSASMGRKLPIIAGLILATTIVSANFVASNTLVIIIMSVAFFGQGMVGLGWTLLTDVAPKRYLGLSGGIFNLVANLSGILTPIIIGVIVAETGSFFGALVYVAAVAALGAVAYIFIVGDVHRVEID